MVFFWTVTAYPQDNKAPELPLSVVPDQIKPLRSLVQKDFQEALEKRLRKNKTWSQLIDRRRMAVGVVDLSDINDIRFARINGNTMMYAASLPKLAILLAAEQALQDGTLKETPAIRNDMRIMISRSDNGAATRMMQLVGGSPAIEKVLRDPRYELYDPNWGGGLWVGKLYAKGGKRYPDPVMGTSHGATASQVCRFYYLLAMGQLVTRERSAEMLNYMVAPEIRHKFVYTLFKLVPEAKIYRKSGTWQQWHSDSALVWGPAWRRYIVVGLIEDSRGEQILRNLIPAVEEVLRQKKR